MMREASNIKSVPAHVSSDIVKAALNFADHMVTAHVVAYSSLPTAFQAESKLAVVDECTSPARALFSGPNWMELRHAAFAQAEQFLHAKAYGVRIIDRSAAVRRYRVGSLMQPMYLEDVIAFAISKGMEING